MSTKTNKSNSKVGNPKVDNRSKAGHSRYNGKGKSSSAKGNNPKSSDKSKDKKRDYRGTKQIKRKTQSAKPAVAQKKVKQLSAIHKQKPSRSSQIFRELTNTWDITNIRPNSDDFIVDCVSNKRVTDLSYWPALMIQRARTAACIGTKIKSASPKQSDEVTIKKFIDTQDEPVLSGRILSLVKAKVDEIYGNFPYEAVKAEIENPDRRPIITNGSSNPQILAPVITGVNGNIELIAAMAAGEKIFLSTFNINEVLTGIADGKVTTVPKNIEKSRVITITSRQLIDKQYVPSDALRDWATKRSRDVNHITQFDDQSVQHAYLKEGYATLDLSSASDRVYRSLIERVWPDFMKYFGEYLPTTVSTDAGRIVPLTCIGTQGFPLTFTVMAIIVGIITEALKLSNKPSANYGDDIVVAEEDFEEVYTGLEACGLVINKSKTHRSSNGFVESCGRDVMFTRNGARDVTPIHLRGESDVEIIQFFHQLCKADIIDVEDATRILDKLHVEYYAFDYDHQLTEFHLPWGDIKNVPKPVWNYDRSQYVCKVPALKQEVVSIKGLSVKESDTVLQLLHIEAGLKNPNNLKEYVRGVDPIARPYAIMDLQDSKLYGLYKKLDAAEDQVLNIFWKELCDEYKTSFKVLSYYRFITSELSRYRYSTATVDFHNHKPVEFSIQELIDTEFGVKSDTRYPIYRYKVSKNSKLITHPSSNLRLGLVEQVKHPLA